MAIILSKLAPDTSTERLQEVANLINKYSSVYGVNTEKRLAAFVAQAVHESAGFSRFKEIGNNSYLKRYEPGTKAGKNLGNIYPGDGAKFKGRGIFQLSGRWNYTYFSKKIFGDDRLVTNPEILETPEYAVLSAFYYWDFKKLNKWADKMDNNAITKIINGPKMYHKQERNALYQKAMAMIRPVTATLSGVAVALIGIFF